MTTIQDIFDLLIQCSYIWNFESPAKLSIERFHAFEHTVPMRNESIELEQKHIQIWASDSFWGLRTVHLMVISKKCDLIGNQKKTFLYHKIDKRCWTWGTQVYNSWMGRRLTNRNCKSQQKVPKGKFLHNRISFSSTNRIPVRGTHTTTDGATVTTTISMIQAKVTG